MDVFDKVIKKLLKYDPKILEFSIRKILVSLSLHFSNKSTIIFLESNSNNSLSIVTPTRFVGVGSIYIGDMVTFGVIESPKNFSESRIEVRQSDSVINIGNNTYLNNAAFIASDGATISIGKRCLIGPEFYAIDSNFHVLPIPNRLERDNDPLDVLIGDDVFIGARVTILKGANVGSGSIIAAGTVIPPRFVAPDNSIIAGNPAQIIGPVRQAS